MRKNQTAAQTRKQFEKSLEDGIHIDINSHNRNPESRSKYGTVKIHFTSSKRAMQESVDGSCTAGPRTRLGRVKTWIAHVPKIKPTETVAEVTDRLKTKNNPIIKKVGASREATKSNVYMKEIALAIKSAGAPIKLSGSEAILTRQARVSYAQGMIMAGYILGRITPEQRKTALAELSKAAG